MAALPQFKQFQDALRGTLFDLEKGNIARIERNRSPCQQLSSFDLNERMMRRNRSYDSALNYLVFVDRYGFAMVYLVLHTDPGRGYQDVVNIAHKGGFQLDRFGPLHFQKLLFQIEHKGHFTL